MSKELSMEDEEKMVIDGDENLVVFIKLRSSDWQSMTSDEWFEDIIPIIN